MYIYVPDKLAAKPAVIVAIHYCQGTANAYYTGSPYAKLAEQYGFIVIYPESPYSGTCWDVSSKAALTHNGGGDSNSIANMVTYTLNKYKGDASRVFVTGSSSGAMMTVCAVYSICRQIASLTDTLIERYGRYLPGNVQGCYRLLWRARRLLRKCQFTSQRDPQNISLTSPLPSNRSPPPTKPQPGTPPVPKAP
jgi:hypothetical protein